jgi:hypothetical protein
MVPTDLLHSDALFYTGVFATLILILLGVSFLGMLWVRTGFTVFAFVVRTAHKLGLYDPDENTGRTESATNRRIDRFCVLYSRVLQSISRLVPGNPRRHPHVVIVPVLLVFVPSVILFLVVMWAIPVTLAGYVAGSSTGSWSTVLAFLSLVAYFYSFVLLWNLTKKAPRWLERGRSRLGI